MKFKDDFIFGGATAAYQCEGSIADYGKGKNEWDVFLEEKGRFKADPASDFYHQYPVDLKLCHDFGVNGIRISIAWTRIFPDGTDKINKEGVEFYHKLFKKCHEEGVEPFVTLHHFDSPAGLYADGDFMNPKTIDAFVEYAKFCFEEYKNDVTYWFTFNEIWAVATNTYIEGTFPNGVTNIIPFFGPFIGAVPSAILIMVVSPLQALYFVIFIIILQQIDGNILGPKILGNSTGLSSFWVMFAILIFGGLFGFVGMAIGVPLFAVIYSIVSEYINHLLKKRGLSEDTNDYRGDKRLDAETREFVHAETTVPPVSARERRAAARAKEQQKNESKTENG